jgi:tRNA (guanine10-N2)-dimethyltransferase
MKLLFFLSGENVELARWEVLNLLSSYGEVREKRVFGRILALDYRGENVFRRLALTHEVCELKAACDFNDLEAVFSEIDVPATTCCVRVKRIGLRVESSRLEKLLGAVLWRRGAKISVTNPENIFRVYITPEKCFVGLLIHKQNKKEFQERNPAKRPFFMPSVILPKLARALVNLSGVKTGTLLDPMCGTGSFLIEAGVMGIEFVGVDFYERIVRGCRENLLFFNLRSNVLRGDVRELPFKDYSVEAIVTDYPYLRSTRASGDLKELYARSLEEFRRVLSGRAVVVTNVDIEDYLNEFKVVAKFKQRVHGTLTRRIYLLS